MIRILSFFQEGCMACQEQEPINREVEEALSVHIEPVNPLKDRSYLEKYSLRVTPTIVILKDGQVVERFEGVVHREQLEEAIQKYL
ncbi:MAG: thioredoxin [Methanomicrobiales archaeon]|nr:thioredoxin [Methanomicrobiales archaeon]NYT21148.1 thioredoxin [Methanomicrobiales archaeon]